MRIELPLFVETGTPNVSKGTTLLRPLFFEQPAEIDREIARARTRLARALAKELQELGADDPRRLARYTFCPDLKLHNFKFRLDLRRQSHAGRFPVVVFRRWERRIAFSPLLPEAWFEVGRGQDLQSRAQEVYTDFFRHLERNNAEDLPELLRRFAPAGKSWIDYLEIEVGTARRWRREEPDLLALLGGAERVDGAQELDRVGTCLDYLYPEQLHRFSGDETPVSQLERFFDGPKRRAVAIVGPSLVGKTTLVHEYVFQRVAHRRSIYSRKANLWHLAPQRLISGMMYLGQWENRLLAILKHARRRDHVLFFDDLLGLYHAGKTSKSDLSVADVLKPYVERGDVRVLAEMTPEALRVFRERDRGFADLFHLIRLDEPAEDQLVPLLLDRIRRLELRRKCQFEIDVLPTILELTRRYEPNHAYPGKAARLLERLATRDERKIDRNTVLEEFHRQSGYDTRLLDRHVRLTREDVADQLAGEIVGQREAVEAMADAVAIAKARLNDPAKPLASMLFLGPTGVGKTECAKALARFLFRDEQRLLRFDMNEFLSPDAAARLVGTFDQPEGLLTSAVRERPAAVVLLDEIEKAHPNVFDLLLQVLGEARLTDGLGRTVDFSNAIVLLTSNLGTGQSPISSGFGAVESTSRETALRAARDFFRPELFNRLDRIIPFAHLSRDELAAIARRTLSLVLAREGLQRRQSSLDVSPELLSWVVEQGYHPQLGARAMKRAVEDHLVHPLAVQLSEIPKSRPTVVRLSRRDRGLQVHVASLYEAETSASRSALSDRRDQKKSLADAQAVLDRLEQQCARHRNLEGLRDGRLEAGGYWYLALSECHAALRRRLLQLKEMVEKQRVSEVVPALAPQNPSTRRSPDMDRHGRQVLKEMVAAQDIHDYLAEMRRQARRQATAPGRFETELCRFVDSLALLHAFRPSEDGWPSQHAAIVIRSLPDARQERAVLTSDLLACHQFDVPDDSMQDEMVWREQPYAFAPVHWSAGGNGSSPVSPWWEMLADPASVHEDLRALPIDVLSLEGPRAGWLLQQQEGSYLFTNSEGRLKPLQASVLVAGSEEELGREIRRCLEGLAGPDAPVDDNRYQWKPVMAVYAWQASVSREGGYRRMIDFRSGTEATTTEGLDPGATFRATLPLPAEFGE